MVLELLGFTISYDWTRKGSIFHQGLVSQALYLGCLDDA